MTKNIDFQALPTPVLRWYATTNRACTGITEDQKAQAKALLVAREEVK